MPGVAASQRWLLRRYLEGQPFVHTVNVGPAAGLNFEITLPQDKPIWTGTYEHEFTRAIVGHIGRGDICYDIGRNFRYRWVGPPRGDARFQHGEAY